MKWFLKNYRYLFIFIVCFFLYFLSKLVVNYNVLEIVMVEIDLIDF